MQLVKYNICTVLARVSPSASQPRASVYKGHKHALDRYARRARDVLKFDSVFDGAERGFGAQCSDALLFAAHKHKSFVAHDRQRRTHAFSTISLVVISPPTNIINL